ncbi:WAP four-disulfide core domain protein 5-like [Chionomys nivalis]|uniref:WAP four-disulfide core domain protein 5-like n=1 Tax=Chionomys nivalis TaxID=269649 RepID=UPI002599763C|nr:WAP four-disulfide core domain protein 5-like [Chionomys nivalis]
MRIQSSLLLVVLLAFETQLPVARCRNKGEKWGGCPPDDGPCLQVTPDQCMNDRQCPSSMKCCSRACFRQCVPRVTVKLGKCPLDQLHCLSPIKHMCNQDSNCSGKKRCCLSACGRDCRDPSKGTVPGGHDRAFLSSLALGCPSRPPSIPGKNRNHRLRPPAASLPPPAAIDAASAAGDGNTGKEGAAGPPQ